MKIICSLLFICFLFIDIDVYAQENKYELDASTSMLMTGKGKGQDGAINPFFGQDCFAIVKNTGDKKFSIRIENKGKLIKTIIILKGEKKKIKLLKGQELYLDTNESYKIKASIQFKEIKN
jgi:hypothetical protein